MQKLTKFFPSWERQNFVCTLGGLCSIQGVSKILFDV